MANDLALLGTVRNSVFYRDLVSTHTRHGLDSRAATLYGKWHENRFGSDVQQFVGVYHPDNSEYVLTDQVATPDPWEYANKASDAAATRCAPHVSHVWSQISS